MSYILKKNMKVLVLLIVALSFIIETRAQESTAKADTVYAFNNVEKCAVNKKCKESDQQGTMSCMMETLLNHVSQYLKYPEDAQVNGIGCQVYLNFIIEKDGTISNIKVVKSVSLSIDSEAIRVLNLFPGFDYPAMKDGNPVRMRITMPITFKIQ